MVVKPVRTDYCDQARYYFYIYYISSHDFGAIRLLELTSIYLLRKRYIKLVAERSYYLRCGQGNLL